MKQYLEFLNDILSYGYEKPNRTGTNTISIFGTQMRFRMRQRPDGTIENFPAVTTKKLAWNSVVAELLWFLRGSNDERELAEILYQDKRENLKDKRTIWTANAENQGKKLGYPDGILGPIYGVQWRHWNGLRGKRLKDGEKTSTYALSYFDQIASIIRNIKKDPFSRRHIVSAWNVAEIDNMALPPCHVLQQYHVVPDADGEPRWLMLSMYQRSADAFLGVPFNIASYSLLLCIIAKLTGLEPLDFVHMIGDAHIYTNHLNQVKEQLKREPLKLPTLVLPEFETLDDVTKLKPSDFRLENYNHLEALKGTMAV